MSLAEGARIRQATRCIFNFASFGQASRPQASLCQEKTSMKNLIVTSVGSVPLLASGVSLAQTGNMMDGGMWGAGWMGGYGGVWVPVLIVVAVVGVVALILKQKGK